jgi:prepilin-type processing-associated H-X9-DG protein
MQFRLSTLFLVFFNVAASLALFGVWGLSVLCTFLLAALCVNKAELLRTGVIFAIFIIFVGTFCCLMSLPPMNAPREAGRKVRCQNNLWLIGHALHEYHQIHGHFPVTNIVDQNGKPLFSWRMEILRFMNRGLIPNSQTMLSYSLKKDESWDSPFNAKILNRIAIAEFNCPSDVGDGNDVMTNYIAIIGPGTAWSEKGPVKLADLPDGGSHTVMVVEVENSGVHWAEPRDLTVDEALERMKTGKGLGISSVHPGIINVLFADGSVRSLRKDMLISTWKKLFDGKTDVDRIDSEDYNSTGDYPNVWTTPRKVDRTPIPEPKIWPYIFSFVVWLFSVVLLFRRAIKSRRKPITETES